MKYMFRVGHCAMISTAKNEGCFIMTSTERLLLTGIVVGVCLGAVAGCLLPLNALQYWKKIDYFPYRIANVVYIDSSDFIWVKTTTGESYILCSPCFQEPCWKKANTSPDYSIRESWGEDYQFQTTQDCSFEHFTYPLFRRTKMCFSANNRFPEGKLWIYLALTEAGELYSWQGSSHSLTVIGFLIGPLIMALFGIIPGVALGFLLLIIKKLQSIIKLSVTS